MKIKFTALLILAMTVASMSVFTSCKDNCEDDYNELRAMLNDQNTKLTELINAQINGVKSEINSLKDQIAAIKSCTCDPSDVDKKIKDALDKYAAEHPELKAGDVNLLIANYLKDNQYITKPEVESLIKVALEAYCKKVDCLDEAAVIALIQKYDQVGISEEQAQLMIDKALVNYVTRTQLETAVARLEEADSIASAKEAADVADLLSKISDVNKKITEAKSLAQTALDLAKADSVRIDGLDATVVRLEGLITDNATEIGKVRIDASLALAKAKANELRIKTLEDIIEKLNSCGCDMSKYYTKAEIDNILKDYATIKYVDELAEKTLQQANDYTDAHIKCFGQNVMEPRLKELQDAYKAADALLQQQINNLQSQINGINTRLNKIENSIKNQITGIVLQGSENAALGSINTPFGIQSNLLVAYYGSDVDAFNFPSKSAHYVFAGEKMTADEWEVIGAASSENIAGVLFNESTGNAGKLYVTINPSERDFEGETLDMVNSKDEFAKATLTPLAHSDKELKFGYTRAANGFYETEVTVAQSDIDAIKIDVEAGLKDAATALIDNKNAASLSDFGYALYNQVNGVLPAYALKASWIDEVAGQRSIYSQYGIGITAIKPLGFGFLKDKSISVPGFQKANDIIDEIAAKIKANISSVMPANGFPEVTLTKIINRAGDISVNLRPKGSVHHFEGTEDGYIQVYDYDKNLCGYIKVASFKDNGDGSYEVRLWKDAAELESYIHRVLSDTQYDNIDDYLSDVNAALQMINNYETKVDNGMQMVKDLLDSMNSKLSVLGNISGIMQPIMLVKDNNGGKTASMSTSYPTSVSAGAATLILTSRNGEILAPAYKKLVACVAVDGDKTAAAAVNTGLLNTVVDGNVTEVPVTLEAGKTYKFIYTAVDYSGQVVARRFYVKAN